MHNMPEFQPRIAIIGGGPSGLALGLLLHQRGVKTTIYELRAKPTQEELAKPSGMLDLHEESGLKAMQECGLWDALQAAMGDCSEAMRVMDPDGVILHSDEGELESRPEVARNSITSLLIRNVPSDIIRWQQKILSVQSKKNAISGATEITLDLGPNGFATYDFVVGADGAWSRVRKLLTDTKPLYSGASVLTATARHVSAKYPHLLKVSGSGTLAALGGGNAIMTQRGPQDSIRMYAAVSTSDDRWVTTAGLQGMSAADVGRVFLGDDKLFSHWAPELQDLLTTACKEETEDNPNCEADIKPWYMLPVGHRWQHQVGMTLIGDAAHLMTPWAGEGVNLALWDALDLAHTITAIPKTSDTMSWQTALDSRICEFEELMLVRAEVKAEETAQNKDTFLSENGAQTMADFFKSAFQEGGDAGESAQLQQTDSKGLMLRE